MVQFDPVTFVLTCAGFFMLCVGLKKLAEAKRIFDERKENHE